MLSNDMGISSAHIRLLFDMLRVDRVSRLGLRAGYSTRREEPVALDQ